MKRFLIAAVLASAALPASASIALFTDGRTMKISAFKLIDKNAIQLTLKNGGAVIMPLARVERIVDDEVVEVEKDAEVKKLIEEGIFPRRKWHYETLRGPLFSSKFDKLIVAAAKKFDVDAALISAVIKAESDFNPREVSNKGARGLMQLMPATAARFGVRNSFDPAAHSVNGPAPRPGGLPVVRSRTDLQPHPAPRRSHPRDRRWCPLRASRLPGCAC